MAHRTRLNQPSGPSLRILIYVDVFWLLGKFGTRHLQDALASERHQLNVTIDVKLRSGLDELKQDTLNSYDEIWFLLGKESVVGKLLPLTNDEIKELHEWMNRGGGVLLCGDHASESRDQKGDPIFEGLGAHVGSLIPRAGQMRIWHGLPGIRTAMADTTGVDEEAMGRQAEADATPQRLLLPRDSAGQAHPIFRDSSDRILDQFPDHQHEGEVKVPVGVDFPGNREVTIIAKGISWRFGRTYDLLAAWDGHAVVTDDPELNYGRILVDSSFHHYVDHNLNAIVKAGGDAWKEIRTIFRNQAAWLAPVGIKRKYRDRVFEWLLEHPYIMEVADEINDVIGSVARPLIAAMLPAAWFHELVDGLIVELGEKPDEPRPVSQEGILFDEHYIGEYLRRMLVAAKQSLIVPDDPTVVELEMNPGSGPKPRLAAAMASGVFAVALSSYRSAVAAAKKEARAQVLGDEPER
jgi:hypothetical protein